MTVEIPTLAELVAFGSTPRIHPNGFIQVDLDQPDQVSRRRVHVWPKQRLPQASVAAPIHDHIFQFRSRVVAGEILHQIYDVFPRRDGAFHLYSVGCSAAGYLNDNPVRGEGRFAINPLLLYEFSAGDAYDFEARLFHATIVKEFAITVIEIGDVDLAKAKASRFLCPVDQRPDRSFRRDAYSSEWLWSIIRSTWQ